MLLSFPESKITALALADSLNLRYREIELHTFPDGESKLTLPEELSDWIFIYRSTHHPHAKLVELLLASQGLKRRGDVDRVSLIAPYLSYMRQDMAFRDGEVVSQRIIAEFLASLFDDVITVDPHLHRINSLTEVMPTCNAIVVSAAELFAEYLIEQRLSPILMGPDAESQQWVKVIARTAKLEYEVAQKVRSGDRAVSIELPDMDYRGQFVMLADDVASTGFTLAEATRMLKGRGVDRIGVLVTHPLFVGNALQDLYQAGVDWVGSSDSIPHESNIVSVNGPIAGAIQGLLADQA